MQFPGEAAVYAAMILLLSAVVIHTLVRKPKTPAHIKLIWALAGLLWSCVCVMLTLLSATERTLYIFNELKFIGLAYAPILMLLFYLEFLRIPVTFFEKAAMAAVPSLTVFFALTNPVHNLFRSQYAVVSEDGFLYFVSHNAPWMYVHHIYSYVITAVGLVLLILSLRRRSAVYREQLLLMTLGLVIACGVSIFVTFADAKDRADASVLAFAFAGLTSYMGFMIYSPKNMLNTARDLAIKSIDAPFVLFNDLCELADFNRCAAGFAGLDETMLGKLELDDFIKSRLGLEGREIDGAEVVLASETWEEVYFRVYARYFTDKGGKYAGCVILLENITQGKRMLKEMSFALHRDKLTGMPNLAAFEKEFGEMIAADTQGVVLLCMSINGMKLANSLFGTAYGDEVISTVAGFITAAAPDRRLCARVAGDEFAVLLTDCRETDANELALSVNVRLKNDKRLKLPVSLSYGAAVRMWDAEPFERLMRRAGENLQRLSLSSKDNGGIAEAICRELNEANICTEAYSAEVRAVAAKFGKHLGLEPLIMEQLDTLALICDIGMLTIPQALLRKTEALTREESELLKLHCVKGYRIALTSPPLALSAPGVLSHHEWWDGTGYPHELSGKKIPLCARIITIANAYARWKEDPDTVRARFSNGAGNRFDPELTEIFIKEFL